MVKANDSAVASCADVTAAHLAALTGTLTAEVGAIEPGDLAGLGSLTGLDLSGGDLVALPAGVFDRLVRLETLRLDDNDLAALPDGIFETLTALDDLRFGGNPGSSGFEPAARAASEADAATGGQTLRLDGTGSGTGPWGANVTWSWERVDAQGNVATPSWLTGADTARPSVTVPLDLIAGRARFRLTVTGRGVDRGAGNAAHTSTATVAVDIRSSPAVETVSVVSHPRAGGTYGLGETIEVALGYTAPVTVTGTPAIELLLGDAPGDAVREAAYARGSGGRRLVFAYTVVAGDRDTDGIRSCSAALETQSHCRAGVLLDAGESVSDADGEAAGLAHAGFAERAGHKVDGMQAAPSGGVCARTAAVRAAIVAAAGEASCADVDAAALAGIGGTLDISDAGLASLAAGDLDGLTGIARLDLSDNGLSLLPSGGFDGLDSLVSLDLSGNGIGYAPSTLRSLAAVTSFKELDLSDNRIAALPASAFGIPTYALALTVLDLSGNEIASIDAETFAPMALGGLRTLDLRANRLATLPEGVFETLEALEALDLRDNPGTAGFVPVVDAGADVAEAPAGETVTGIVATVAGPWGDGVEWEWEQVSGKAVTNLSGDTAALGFRASTGSTDRVLEFRVTATGRGTTARGSDTVTVTVVPPPKATAIDVISGPQTGTTYGEGEVIEVRATFSHAVEVSSKVSYWLDVGGTRRAAVYASGSGGREIDFAYTVKAADADTDGIAGCTTSIDAACNGEFALGGNDSHHAAPRPGSTPTSRIRRWPRSPGTRWTARRRASPAASAGARPRCGRRSSRRSVTSVSASPTAARWARPSWSR